MATNGAPVMPSIAQLRTATRGGVRGTPFDPLASLRFFGNYTDGSVTDIKWDVRAVERAFESEHGAQLEKNFQTLALPIRSAPWEIKDAPDGKREGDAAREMFGRLLGPLIDRSVNALWSKKTYHEIEWDVSAGAATVTDLHWRPVGACSDRRDDAGRLNGFLQQLPFDSTRRDEDRRWPGKVWIEPLRAFVYINGRNRNPILGHSDLQITWALAESVRKLSLILFQFLELQAVPRVLAYGQNGTDAENNADALSATTGGGIVPWTAPTDGSKPYDVLESSGTGSGMFLETLRWLQAQQVSSILADFTTLSEQASNGRGSYALSSDQRAWFESNLQAKATELADQITEQVLRPAALLNFGSDARVPSMSIGPVSSSEIDNAMTMLNSTVTTQNPNIPPGVVDALWIKVSRKLGLDVDQVREAVEQWRADSEKPDGAEEDDGDGFALAHTIDEVYGLVTDALDGVDPSDALNRRLELARKVRTAAGAKRYGVPIGSPIPPGGPGGKVKRAAARGKGGSSAAPSRGTGKVRSTPQANGGGGSSRAVSSNGDANDRARSTQNAANELAAAPPIKDTPSDRQTQVARAAQLAAQTGKTHRIYEDAGGTHVTDGDAPAGRSQIVVRPDGAMVKIGKGGTAKPIPADAANTLLNAHLDTIPAVSRGAGDDNLGTEKHGRIKLTGVDDLPADKREAFEAATAAIARVHSTGGMPAIGVAEMPADRPYQGMFRPSQGYGSDGVFLGDTVDPGGTLVHEFGHAIDWTALSPDGERGYGTESEQRTPVKAALLQFLGSARRSDAMANIRDAKGATATPNYVQYLQRDTEVWARAYHQYIVTKGGDSKMRAALAKQQRRDAADNGLVPEQWSDEDFEAVGAAVERVLVAKGWL